MARKSNIASRKLSLQEAQSLIDKATGRERGTKESDEHRRESSTSKYGPKFGDDDAERVISEYAATHMATFPEIQPHELEAVRADFEFFPSRGLAVKGETVEAFLRDRLMERRKFAWLEQSATKYLQNKKTREMRDAKEQKTIERHREKRALAQAAYEWAKHQYPTQRDDNYVGFLKDKAAEHIEVSRDTFDRYLAYEE